jgi:hypothetical protein
MQRFSANSATRGWLKVGLVFAGVVAGAAFGVLLTRFGKIVAGAPPATLANYAWNAAMFGLAAGIIGPIVSWSSLRRAPLWRTVVEPLGWAVAGGTAAVVTGSGVLLPALPPLGLAVGFARLRHRFPDPHAFPSARPVATIERDGDVREVPARALRNST